MAFDNSDEQLLLDEKVKLFKEWFESPHFDPRMLPFREVLEDLKEVKSKRDGSGQVDPATVSGQVRALLNAFYASHLTPPSMYDQATSVYQSFLQKQIFFRQRTVDTVEELEDVIRRFSAKRKHLFRGVHDASFMLYSSLQRTWKARGWFNQAIDYHQFVARLVANARLYCGGILARYIDAHGGDYNNDVSVLSILQHYGCPTPILDWTYDFRVALYFSALGASSALPRSSREIDRYLSIYYIKEKWFTPNSLRVMLETSLKGSLDLIRPAVLEKLEQDLATNPAFATFTTETIEKFKQDDEALVRAALSSYHVAGLTNHMCQIDLLSRIPAFYFSDREEEYVPIGLQNSPNVTNQQGVFTWNNSAANPMEHTVREMMLAEKPDTIHYYTKCLNINKALIPHIFDHLAHEGITPDFIFPEKDQEHLRNLVWRIFEITAKEFEPASTAAN
ncbi:FRG domain-containing protein [Hymenobacter latericus]|uniref:FRG domain-containing protein n=1 Tax=Hymenobacter sp. YIM 151858-1 TaxID=2987688 RepID=UPI0022267CB5|nr:FRG domain-containing protein [Hymenobacter sp. YIM 151858-1]UYZ61280.1 FRG domain-containing protein [Hymenobacter sp. YIM 151858-1]